VRDGIVVTEVLEDGEDVFEVNGHTIDLWLFVRPKDCARVLGKSVRGATQTKTQPGPTLSASIPLQ
jgi:hypothetical protein